MSRLTKTMKAFERLMEEESEWLEDDDYRELLIAIQEDVESRIDKLEEQNEEDEE